MKSARPLAPWLVAMIVMIAAALMPSGARAHGGHGHDGGVVPAVSVRPTGPETAASSVLRSTGVTAFAGLSGTRTVEPARLACACPACMAGAACGHAPSSCCATALPPSLTPGLAAPVASGRARFPDGPRRSGIVPEAQIEPPRPIA